MKKCLLLPLGLCLTHTSLAEPVFLPGVTEESGWYDCNKKTKWEFPTKKLGIVSQPTQPTDYNKISPLRDESMCWAAAASNVLQWWQDSRSDITPTTPNGYASSYSTVYSDYTADWWSNVAQLQIYQEIGSNWSNGGGSTRQAWNYWFNGGILPVLNNVAIGGEAGPSVLNGNGGGYWQQLGLTVSNPDDYNSLADNPLFSSYVFYNADTQETVYSKLTESIDKHYGTTLTIGDNSRGHAITMWGYEYDQDGSLIVYLTDSDDYQTALFKQKVIVKTVETTDGNGTGTGVFDTHIYLTALEGEENTYTYDYGNGITGTRLGEIQSLKATLGNLFLAVPEPASTTLTLLAIGALLFRRQKR